MKRRNDNRSPHRSRWHSRYSHLLCCTSARHSERWWSLQDLTSSPCQGQGVGTNESPSSQSPHLNKPLSFSLWNKANEAALTRCQSFHSVFTCVTSHGPGRNFIPRAGWALSSQFYQGNRGSEQTEPVNDCMQRSWGGPRWPVPHTSKNQSIMGRAMDPTLRFCVSGDGVPWDARDGPVKALTVSGAAGTANAAVSVLKELMC